MQRPFSADLFFLTRMCLVWSFISVIVYCIYPQHMHDACVRVRYIYIYISSSPYIGVVFVTSYKFICTKYVHSTRSILHLRLVNSSILLLAMVKCIYLSACVGTSVFVFAFCAHMKYFSNDFFSGCFAAGRLISYKKKKELKWYSSAEWVEMFGLNSVELIIPYVCTIYNVQCTYHMYEYMS